MHFFFVFDQSIFNRAKISIRKIFFPYLSHSNVTFNGIYF